MSEFRIVQSGDRVILLKNGEFVADMPYQAALQLAQALREKGKLAEQLAHIDNVLLDAQILKNARAPGNIVGGFVGSPSLYHGSPKE